eukprot:4457160-Amphidinium_carterae.1
MVGSRLCKNYSVILCGLPCQSSAWYLKKPAMTAGNGQACLPFSAQSDIKLRSNDFTVNRISCKDACAPWQHNTQPVSAPLNSKISKGLEVYL